MLHYLSFSFLFFQGKKRRYYDQQESNSEFGSQPSKSSRTTEIKECVDPQSFRGLSQIFQNIQYHNEDPLSKKMWDLFMNQRQRDAEFQRKIDLWVKFDRIIGNEFGYATHVFGSTINGFGSRNSDMDICVFANSEKHRKNTISY